MKHFLIEPIMESEKNKFELESKYTYKSQKSLTFTTNSFPLGNNFPFSLTPIDLFFSRFLFLSGNISRDEIRVLSNLRKQ